MYRASESEQFTDDQWCQVSDWWINQNSNSLLSVYYLLWFVCLYVNFRTGKSLTGSSGITRGQQVQSNFLHVNYVGYSGKSPDISLRWVISIICRYSMAGGESLRKIIKIVASRCHIFKLKWTKFDFGCGFTPDPASEAYYAPQTPSWIWRILLLRGIRE